MAKIPALEDLILAAQAAPGERAPCGPYQAIGQNCPKPGRASRWSVAHV